MDDLIRVFYHELGHFVAHEINSVIYSGSGVKSIDIYPCDSEGDLYVGELKINLSEDEKEKEAPSIIALPAYLASSTYGCIFQAYYKKESLKDCFKKNGDDDALKWHNSIYLNNLIFFKGEIVITENNFFDKIIKTIY